MNFRQLDFAIFITANQKYEGHEENILCFYFCFNSTHDVEGTE
jgi:hypothetical protein